MRSRVVNLIMSGIIAFGVGMPWAIGVVVIVRAVFHLLVGVSK